MAEITVEPLGNGAYRVTDGQSARVAYGAADGPVRWVFLEGRVYLVEAGADSPRPAGTAGRASKRRGSADEQALAAPMPATVVTIAVEPGQHVARGDVLIVLEAMKMELPIKAPRDAAVKAVACRTGELVQPGVPLLELE